MIWPTRIDRLSFALFALGLLALTDSQFATLHAESAAADPPIARVRSKTLVEHGRLRVDDYDWLRNAEDPEVLSYLDGENAYANCRLRRIKPLVDEIATELRAREAHEETSAPYVDNGYAYERRFAEGAQHPVILRRRQQPTGGPEEVVLDIGALAADHSYYRVNHWQVSPDGARVAFAVDFTGARRHRIFVRTIATGEVVDQGITDAAPSLAFAADSKTLFYVRAEPKTARSYEVWRHRIDSDRGSDERVYAENDPQFEVFVSLSKSGRYVLIASDQENTSEMRFLRADQPDGEFTVMEPRRPGVRYSADHVGDMFFIRTNLDAPDYRLMTAPADRSDAAHWAELIPERPGHHLWRVEPFEDFVAIDEEHDGVVTVRVVRLADRRDIPVPLPNAIGAATTDFQFGGFGGNRDPSSHVLRLRFSTPLQPEQTYDFDVASGALTLRKQDAASRWFRPDAYQLERIAATAPDGERVPVTLVYRKDLRRTGGNPTVLLGYGAYGLSSRPIFRDATFSLIDRGFVYAIAHVRGGHERGERWYSAGRVLTKRNTFTDFIAAAEALIASGHADPRALFAQGRSAGGLLVGAVANLRPELFAGVVAEVPFVDVITTMSDASTPLTTLEYDEWGNPALEEHYDYMRSYSPYDNIDRKPYPAMFVTAAIHDSQVLYAEPAKWVARLRARKTDHNELVFRVQMGAGHIGPSGRFGWIEETAEITAWLVAQAAQVEGAVAHHPPH